MDEKIQFSVFCSAFDPKNEKVVPKLKFSVWEENTFLRQFTKYELHIKNTKNFQLH